MRLLALASLLCLLLLCFCIHSSEGRRHPPKFLKSRLCCYPFPRSKQPNRKALASQEVVLTVENQNRNYTRICRLCKSKPPSKSWVVPGALPQV
ncbi:protein GPR15LG [Alexandromys fortis]|uniref:protein GPR15LG n=1 Tax=Alexandromys fortis TaxID=100897 RepID=UPI0021538BFE|nr:protein GPR15LG [Microtus fortis]